MKILVTGGKGYIGSVLCKLLLAKGHESLCFDLKQGYDLTDKNSLARAFGKFMPDAVIHLAAVSSVPECEANPKKCQKVNIDGTAMLLAAMQEFSCTKLIFASSSAVYDDSRSINPKNLYGASKLEGEKLIEASGQNSVIFRIFNAAGAHPQLEAGECHEPETHIIPLSIRAALSGKVLEIHGTGETVRDYVHVWDLAIAFEKALKLTKPGSTMIELGTGTGHSVLQVVSAVEEVTGRQIKRKHVNPRKEISRLISNPAAAREVLGWEPQYTVLKDIIKSEFAWQKSGNHCIK